MVEEVVVDGVVRALRPWVEKEFDEFGMPCAVLSERQVEDIVERVAKRVVEVMVR